MNLAKDNVIYNLNYSTIYSDIVLYMWSIKSMAIYILTWSMIYLCHTFGVKEQPIKLIGPIFYIKEQCFALLFWYSYFGTYLSTCTKKYYFILWCFRSTFTWHESWSQLRLYSVIYLLVFRWWMIRNRKFIKSKWHLE